MATYYYFRVSTVLAAVAVAAMVAMLVGYGNASAATSTGAIITVNTDQDESTSNDGKCSLREAITNANDNAQTSPDCPAGSPSDEDTINFNLGTSATITLDSTLSTLSITDANGLIIDGRKAAITISGNDTVQVFQESAGAKLTLKNLRVAHGKADVFGGGAYNNGGTLIVDHSTFSKNESGFDGGGIASTNGGTLRVTNSTFSDNSALQGGGIYNGGGTLEVTDSTFSGNNSTGNPSFGAGLFNDGGSTATVTKSTFSNNKNATADGRGAGIHNEGTLDVINSTLSGNNNDGDTSSYAGISNLGTLTVTSTTLSNNGIGNENAATLSNTILANVPSGDNCSLLSPLTDEGYNISDDGSCNFDESTSTSRNDTDPKLDPNGLKNNGGPTQTIALLKGSPALNTIPNGQNGCATATDRIATDQRGVKRPQGTRCDIGAYEKKVKRH